MFIPPLNRAKQFISKINHKLEKNKYLLAQNLIFKIKNKMTSLFIIRSEFVVLPVLVKEKLYFVRIRG